MSIASRGVTVLTCYYTYTLYIISIYAQELHVFNATSVDVFNAMLTLPPPRGCPGRGCPQSAPAGPVATPACPGTGLTPATLPISPFSSPPNKIYNLLFCLVRNAEGTACWDSAIMLFFWVEMAFICK